MRRYRVVIADDQPAIRAGIAALVEWDKLGYELSASVANGEQALRLAEAGEADLLLTDIRMPVMDGLELTRAARARRLPVRIVLISGYRDFSYAQSAIELGAKAYLLKPLSAEKLTETLLSVRDDLRRDEIRRQQDVDHALRALLYAPQEARTSLERLAACGVRFGENAKYCAALLSLDGSLDDLSAMLDDEEEELSLPAVVEAFLSRYLPCRAVMLEDGQLALIFSSPEADGEGIKRALTEFAGQINTMTFAPLRAGVGGAVAHPSELSQSFAQARSVLQESTRKAPASFIIADARDAAVRRVDDSPLLSAVRGDEKRLDAERARYFSALRARNTPLSQMRFSVAELFLRLVQLVSESDGDVRELFSDDLRLRDIYSARDETALEETLRVICARAANCFRRFETHDCHVNLDEIIRFVDQHCGEELNLKRLSQQFYISPAYLGRIFTAKTGKKLSAYVNDIRIQKARRMLEDSDEKICLICEEVGYKSLKYFYKVFKESLGITPAEYRMTKWSK